MKFNQFIIKYKSINYSFIYDKYKEKKDIKDISFNNINEFI